MVQGFFILDIFTSTIFIDNKIKRNKFIFILKN